MYYFMRFLNTLMIVSFIISVSLLDSDTHIPTIVLFITIIYGAIATGVNAYNEERRERLEDMAGIRQTRQGNEDRFGA